jgi:hypothetical protein
MKRLRSRKRTVKSELENYVPWFRPWMKLFKKKSRELHLFIWLYCKATHQDWTPDYLKFRGTLHRGQLLMGLDLAEEETGIPRTTVGEMLKRFEGRGLIHVGSTGNGRLITILIYPQTEQQVCCKKRDPESQKAGPSTPKNGTLPTATEGPSLAHLVNVSKKSGTLDPEKRDPEPKKAGPDNNIFDNNIFDEVKTPPISPPNGGDAVNVFVEKWVNAYRQILRLAPSVQNRDRRAVRALLDGGISAAEALAVAKRALGAVENRGDPNEQFWVKRAVCLAGFCKWFNEIRRELITSGALDLEEPEHEESEPDNPVKIPALEFKRIPNSFLDNIPCLTDTELRAVVLVARSSPSFDGEQFQAE